MANCPNCGSDHIQIIRETNVSWGRAVAGWALFGVVGGAVGAVTGEDRNVISCLNCGSTWKAAELYRTIQIINNLTGVKLDLSLDNHRNFMNDVIPEITKYIESLSLLEKETQLPEKLNPAAAVGVYTGFTICFCISIWIMGFKGFGWGLLFLILGFAPFGGIGMIIMNSFYDVINNSSFEKRKIKLLKATEENKAKNKRVFDNKIASIKAKNKL